MNRLSADRVTSVIDAPAPVIYEAVSSVTRTPEWSDQVIACRWVPPATGPAVGARFVATNRRSWLTWRNTPVVTVADPDRQFAFQRTEHAGGTLVWSYLLEPLETLGTQDHQHPHDHVVGQTRVTLGYEVTKSVPVGLHLFLRLFGVRDMQADLHQNMRASLDRLATLTTTSWPPAGQR